MSSRPDSRRFLVRPRRRTRDRKAVMAPPPSRSANPPSSRAGTESGYLILRTVVIRSVGWMLGSITHGLERQCIPFEQHSQGFHALIFACKKLLRIGLESIKQLARLCHCLLALGLVEFFVFCYLLLPPIDRDAANERLAI